MGNFCCKKPENDSLNTIESETKEVEPIKDNYPHDSDIAFKKLKKREKNNINKEEEEKIKNINKI